MEIHRRLGEPGTGSAAVTGARATAARKTKFASAREPIGTIFHIARPYRTFAGFPLRPKTVILNRRTEFTNGAWNGRSLRVG